MVATNSVFCYQRVANRDGVDQNSCDLQCLLYSPKSNYKLGLVRDG